LTWKSHNLNANIIVASLAITRLNKETDLMMSTSTSTSTDEHWRQDVTIDDIPPEGQRLLRDYAGLQQDEILAHIEHIVRAVLLYSRVHCTYH
jgi:hypothetical protein